MRLSLLLTMTVVCHAAIMRHSHRQKDCVTSLRLRDKWRFVNQGRRPFIRIRRGALVFRNGRFRVRFKCVDSFKSIYLFRKSNYKEGFDAAVCLGFAYVADNNYAEFTVTRLMGQGIGSHVISPQLFPHGQHVTVNSTCDIQEPKERRQYAFLERSDPGCKFPRQLQGSWNFTYLHARSLDFEGKRMTLVLLDGRRMVFTCETRDSNRYVLISHGFPNGQQDSYMCVHFIPVKDDPFYSFVFSRLNSGNFMDGLLRVVKRGQVIRLHQSCDWLDSPARPEFMYP